ncbi:MAG: LemA family protein [Thermoguttaceae bacterium]
MEPSYASYLPILGLLLGLLSIYAAFRSGRRWRLVEGLPVSKTTGVFIGLVELEGTAECPAPLTSYLTAAACVWYHWSVEEEWSRTVTETYTDSNGKTQTRTRTESGWTTVAEGGEQVPFYLQDDCGIILVHPEGAKIEPKQVLSHNCGRSDPLYYGKGPAAAIGNSDHRRRFVERALPHRAMLYVVGQARERQDVVAPEIVQDRGAPLFLISTRSKEQVSSGMKWGERGWFIFALILILGSIVARDLILKVDWHSHVQIYILAGLGVVVAGVLAWTWMVFNSLVDLRQRVRQAWSLVDVQLQRRHDLIPNLVASVQGYRDYEQKLQSELAALRSQLGATPPGVAGPDFGAVAKVVNCVMERYPDLKANTTFTSLQKNLIDTEQRIALARGYFNEIATNFNTRLEIIPEKFVAPLAAMKPQPLMAANDFERAAVTVTL